MKKYTLWFYAYDNDFYRLIPKYDIFTGSRYQCYKRRNAKIHFRCQYKVCISKFQ